MKTLIVYFSKTGNTKIIAEELAKNLHADLEEITEIKPTEGIIGWLVAGKNATLQKGTPINEIKHQLSDYDLVIIGTPIWAWTMSNPIRTFIEKYKQDLKKTAFFATMGGSGDKRAFKHMQEILNQTPITTTSFIDKKVKKSRFQTKLLNFIENINKNTGN